MIDKVEAGKSYKLIDKDGYFSRQNGNTKRYRECIKGDIVKIDRVDFLGYGWCEDICVISTKEYQYFELVDGDSLTKLTLPFVKLDNRTKKDLVCASIDGAVIEYLFPKSTRWVVVTRDTHLEFWNNCVYRVKPPVSEKDKLIAAAQQKLKEAQEELVKAQGL